MRGAHVSRPRKIESRSRRCRRPRIALAAAAGAHASGRDPPFRRRAPEPSMLRGGFRRRRSDRASRLRLLLRRGLQDLPLRPCRDLERARPVSPAIIRFDPMGRRRHTSDHDSSLVALPRA
jgi:hypothetical protein